MKHAFLRLTVLAICALGPISGCSRTTVPPRAESTNTPQAASPSHMTHFIQGYVSGAATARQSRKPMLIFFTAPSSLYCEQMLHETFQNERVVELSNAFTCVLVNASDEPEICQDFDVQGYPTVQFVSTGGVPLHRIEGKSEPKELIPRMQSAIETVAARETVVAQPILR